jgi:hypothetical protein
LKLLVAQKTEAERPIYKNEETWEETYLQALWHDLAINFQLMWAFFGAKMAAPLWMGSSQGIYGLGKLLETREEAVSAPEGIPRPAGHSWCFIPKMAAPLWKWTGARSQTTAIPC